MNFAAQAAIKWSAGVAFVCLLGGCELLNQVTQVTQENKVEPLPIPNLCATQAHKEQFEQFCDSSEWISYMIEIQQFDWSQRKQFINELDDRSSAVIKKILLSQGADTPYKYRLRAQNWIDNINTETPAEISILLNDIIFEHSKQLLEFESAITILSKVNARQVKTIHDLQISLTERDERLQKQKDQVEQLLRIETDLVEQNRMEKR
jgi:hypothetical protein